eukprot:3597430-Amphidinium_carterae.1
MCAWPTECFPKLSLAGVEESKDNVSSEVIQAKDGAGRSSNCVKKVIVKHTKTSQGTPSPRKTPGCGHSV